FPPPDRVHAEGEALAWPVGFRFPIWELAEVVDDLLAQAEVSGGGLQARCPAELFQVKGRVRNTPWTASPTEPGLAEGVQIFRLGRAVAGPPDATDRTSNSSLPLGVRVVRKMPAERVRRQRGAGS